jgi:lipopolysaccharide biosynthesis glycosyltransferase
MIDVFSWIKSWPEKDRPFLILGKGPSFEFRGDFDLEKFNLIALNHVVRELNVDFAHIIDIDVVEDCADCLESQAKWLLMPLVPHMNCRPTSMRLQDFVETIPVLARFREQNRLLTYPLWTGPRIPDIEPVLGTFSGSVVVNLLSRLGADEVRSLGLDGGQSYSETFSDLNDITLFKNNHDSFDIQFSEISKTIRSTQMDYRPLIEPIRVFVGCDDYQMVAARVLEHSIRTHTRHPVQMFFMKDMPVPEPKHKKNKPGTGFSFNRFLIPKLAGYCGKAIYIDADMLVFDDISKLWNIPFNGKKVLCSTQDEVPKGWEDDKNNSLGEDRHWTPGRQMSVMLLDCERLDWDIEKIVAGLDEGKYKYKELMSELCILDEDDIGDSIPNEWNCLEWYEDGRSQLVHFTVVPTQPWRHENNKLNTLWENAYREAVSAGAIPISMIEDFANRKLIKSSLLKIANSLSVEAVLSEHKDSFKTKVQSESECLRHMLWDSMIEASAAKQELNRIRSSPSFWLEEMIVRNPYSFTIRALRWLRRKLNRS